MAGEKVTAGKYYVNNARSIAREVLAIKKNAVIFVTYHLDTGNSVGYPSECMKQHFTRWADHEATPTEIASLEKFKMHAPPL